MENPLLHPFVFLYQLMQWFLDKLLSPEPPNPGAKLGRPKIAIIGAGLTGVSAASHCVGHGFDVQIFEAGPRKQLGGIWSRVNNTSGLQIHSIMYRFHPSIRWDGGYPNRQQIVSQITELWKRYGLEEKTKFDTKVDKVYQDEKGRWVINNPSLGRFDGIIAAVGTCGDSKMPHIPGQEKFKGEIYHSSDLTGKEAKGKKMIVIGGGASAVEALEFASHEEAAKTYILARSDKWIIPRNPVVDIILSFNIFGGETPFSFIPEFLLKKFFYRDLEDLAPTDKGLFTGTPMVNSDVMDKIRSGQAEWLRGDIKGFTEEGIMFSQRGKGVPAGGPGRERLIKGDMVVMATGFDRPSLSFLPEDSFGEPYNPPNWYLQTFPPTHPSICANNCTYINAIGSVGNWHIGIYTRILLMFLSDPLTRPRPFWMERWIDMTRFVKNFAPTGAFDFFTYLELVWWFTFCIAINPFRWKWAFFVFFGLGHGLPRKVVDAEDRIRNGLGVKNGENYDAGKSF
ncbi:FAD/NAD(P)-binding domain-containing protein [Mollisia scopiformis]|uniref:FAD/NAD(P)-binding domain-containing protein n=1 Tax=Mollisia scopiformis TaxID=149040 RepID=A0A194XB67_MOLSC|nr:FAD/NAD(P)-binding domain-containing protein [Mollisia scopiformis]KUJ17002.1 FAD/NAD(P)-binding domain-containing protein [Mollisia scopiformis]